MQASLFQEDGKPRTFIFRATIKINGIVYRAKDYGHKAWKIPVY